MLPSVSRHGFFGDFLEVSPKEELSRATTEAMKYTTATVINRVYSQTAGRVLQSETCILQLPPYSPPSAPQPTVASLPIFQSPGHWYLHQFQALVTGYLQWNLYSSGNYAITSRFLSFFLDPRDSFLVSVESNCLGFFLFFHFLAKLSGWKKTEQKEYFHTAGLALCSTESFSLEMASFLSYLIYS